MADGAGVDPNNFDAVAAILQAIGGDEDGILWLESGDSQLAGVKFNHVEIVTSVMIDMSRDELGQLVRAVWIRWAKQQTDPKPSWLVPWADLGESDREVDRQIGESVFRFALLVAAHALKNVQFGLIGQVRWPDVPEGSAGA